MTIAAQHDHRIGMSFLTLGMVAAQPITVSGCATIETSFPGFAAHMSNSAPQSPVKGMIIAIDGSAASGKAPLPNGLPHIWPVALDTGALYRAVGLQLLNAGQDPKNIR
ncbi:MAG: hypothetical protein CM15mP46_4480 [Alphaproteobacteria bacterium]|nr:MAG: hypothetical protein CM15mP46_4480 [Alphaproteobacteria bacterium]